MKYLELFITFLKIGAFSFGGGLAMIPFFEKEISLHNWVPIKDYIKVIALAQMIPGPFAINSSAYIGFAVSGLLGAIIASIALSLPSFILSILVTKFYIQFKANNYVRLALDGVRPAVIGLLISAVYIIGVQPFIDVQGTLDILILVKAVLLVAAGFLLLKFTKVNTLIFIAVFAVAGVILF
jgi:chromate transporter